MHPVWKLSLTIFSAVWVVFWIVACSWYLGSSPATECTRFTSAYNDNNNNNNNNNASSTPSSSSSSPLSAAYVITHLIPLHIYTPLALVIVLAAGAKLVHHLSRLEDVAQRVLEEDLVEIATSAFSSDSASLLRTSSSSSSSFTLSERHTDTPDPDSNGGADPNISDAAAMNKQQQKKKKQKSAKSSTSNENKFFTLDDEDDGDGTAGHRGITPRVVDPDGGDEDDDELGGERGENDGDRGVGGGSTDDHENGSGEIDPSTDDFDALQSTSIQTDTISNKSKLIMSRTPYFATRPAASTPSPPFSSSASAARMFHSPIRSFRAATIASPIQGSTSSTSATATSSTTTTTGATSTSTTSNSATSSGLSSSTFCATLGRAILSILLFPFRAVRELALCFLCRSRAVSAFRHYFRSTDGFLTVTHLCISALILLLALLGIGALADAERPDQSSSCSHLRPVGAYIVALAFLMSVCFVLSVFVRWLHHACTGGAACIVCGVDVVEIPIIQLARQIARALIGLVCCICYPVYCLLCCGRGGSSGGDGHSTSSTSSSSSAASRSPASASSLAANGSLSARAKASLRAGASAIPQSDRDGGDSSFARADSFADDEDSFALSPVDGDGDGADEGEGEGDNRDSTKRNGALHASSSSPASSSKQMNAARRASATMRSLAAKASTHLKRVTSGRATGGRRGASAHAHVPYSSVDSALGRLGPDDDVSLVVGPSDEEDESIGAERDGYADGDGFGRRHGYDEHADGEHGGFVDDEDGESMSVDRQEQLQRLDDALVGPTSSVGARSQRGGGGGVAVRGATGTSRSAPAVTYAAAASSSSPLAGTKSDARAVTIRAPPSASDPSASSAGDRSDGGDGDADGGDDDEDEDEDYDYADIDVSDDDDEENEENEAERHESVISVRLASAAAAVSHAPAGASPTSLSPTVTRAARSLLASPAATSTGPPESSSSSSTSASASTSSPIASPAAARDQHQHQHRLTQSQSPTPSTHTFSPTDDL